MTRKRVAILISGSGSNMVRLLECMAADCPGDPVLVLSNREDAAGLVKAAAHGAPTQVVVSKGRDRAAFEAALDAALRAAEPDVICLAGFMRILSTDFVDRWAGRILNIHPSLLPLFPGLNTHTRALDAGVAVHGCTVHVVTPDLDAGPILGQGVVPVQAEDTAQTLAARVLEVEHRLYPAVLRAFLLGTPDKPVVFHG